jgi:hypothetical protein
LFLEIFLSGPRGGAARYFFFGGFSQGSPDRAAHIVWELGWGICMSTLEANSQKSVNHRPYTLVDAMGGIFPDKLSCDGWPGLCIIPARSGNFKRMAALISPSRWAEKPTKIKDHV